MLRDVLSCEEKNRADVLLGSGMAKFLGRPEFAVIAEALRQALPSDATACDSLVPLLSRDVWSDGWRRRCPGIGAPSFASFWEGLLAFASFHADPTARTEFGEHFNAILISPAHTELRNTISLQVAAIRFLSWMVGEQASSPGIPADAGALKGLHRSILQGVAPTQRGQGLKVRSIKRRLAMWLQADEGLAHQLKDEFPDLFAAILGDPDFGVSKSFRTHMSTMPIQRTPAGSAFPAAAPGLPAPTWKYDELPPESRESLDWAESKKSLSSPLLVPRELLEQMWPSWNFSVVVVNSPVTLNIAAHQIELDVDIRRERFGIYNNQGKHFLADKYFDPGDGAKRARLASAEVLANELHRAHLGRSPARLQCNPFDAPLRWASAGFLPIVKRGGRYWCVLFFRDIRPIGWNVANGASESEDERVYVDKLIEREFREELLVLPSRPRPNSPVFLRPIGFALAGAPGGVAPPQGPNPLESIHRRLRAKVDSINIDEAAAESPLRVEVVPGPVTVTVHSGVNTTTKSTGNYVCINPTEFGIEVIKIGVFESEADFLDAETVMDAHGAHRLVRRPVGLFSLDHLHDAWAKSNKTLGTLVLNDPKRLDCRELPVGLRHPDGCLLSDIELVTRRNWCKQNQRESSLERGWLTDYETHFDRAMGGQEFEPRLRSLCPVTWKVLEMAFSWGTLEPYLTHPS